MSMYNYHHHHHYIKPKKQTNFLSIYITWLKLSPIISFNYRSEKKRRKTHL